MVLLELYPIFRLSLQTQNPCHSQHEDGYALLVSIEQYFLDYSQPNSSALFSIPCAAGITIGAVGKDLDEVVKAAD